MHYNRLILGVLTANVVLLGIGIRGGWWASNSIDLAAISNAALANFVLAIVIRQQYVVNLLFWLATRAPTHWPLKVRWTLGKVYHFGGLHVGAAIAGTLWFLALVGSLTYQVAHSPGGLRTATVVVSYGLVALLLAIVVTALPPVRARKHDIFEKSHRFGGWTALGLLWVQTVLFITDQHPGVGAVLSAPGTWLLAVVTVSIALPWLRLRRVPITIERPSSHAALVRFDHGVTPFAGSSTAISRSPLKEWHSFANVPAPGQPGFRLTISRAGDWTGSFIDDAALPRVGQRHHDRRRRQHRDPVHQGCVRRHRQRDRSGPAALARRASARPAWCGRPAAPAPRTAMHSLTRFSAVQPDATIWDTSEHGKPDMVAMAYEAYQAFGAEAVICISNKKLTWQVVHGLERRGIPAYGAIWDS